ncbi:unnamed protein product [Thelazia callipaeda]|uniref:LEM domain-containing protein n=1 Tax=Thelazia callipaeda TaxID=103827 RepID=A0A0N5D3Q1_THECL|nr:unnamed protein product [Thelazia callipaeda]
MSLSSKINLLHLLAASDTVTALDAVHNLLKTGQKQVHEREEDGLTALHVAAAWDNLAMCQLLMYFGADPFHRDDYGRTPKDMANGSVKKFFSRLYETEVQGRNNIRRSFLRALCQLFSCPMAQKDSKVSMKLKRSHSWSPSYDGTSNFLSKDEKRLQWAFRKNQSLLFRNNAGKVQQESAQCLSQGTKSSEKMTSSTVGSPHTFEQRDITVPCEIESNDAMYITAREYGCTIVSDEKKEFDKFSDDLCSQIASLSIHPTQLGSKNQVVEKSTASMDESENIPPKILEAVRLMSGEQIKRELIKRGEIVGPLFESTRFVYELKLARIMANILSSSSKSKYSLALERCIASGSCPSGGKMDQIVMDTFAKLSKEECREGNRPTCFCYILIDPSFIAAPYNSCTMKQFVDSIFYIGKGKRSRPFQHLVDAVRAKGFGDSVIMKSNKLQKIVNLWTDGRGVVSLHVFQNTIPVEAFTREAAMIDAIGIENLTNVKRGEYYGPMRNWTASQKATYGSYLLLNALAIFHVEGCREIYENDVQDK